MSGAQSSSYWNILTFFLTAVVSVLGTVYFMRREPGVPGAPASGNMIVGLLTDTVGYLPHIMLLFGVVADAITQEGVYSIPSLIGVISIVLNWVLAYFWTAMGDVVNGLRELVANQGSQGSFAPPGGISASVAARQARQRAALAGGGKPGDFSGNYDGCDVQGFSKLHSKYAPQTLVVTATVFAYYLFDLISNRGWKNAGSAFGLFAVLFLAQIGVIGDCDVGEIGRFTKAAIAAAEGILFGGASYAVVQAYFPARLPSAAMSSFPRKSKGDLTPGPNGTMVDADGVPYVCLPSGQCIPDLGSMDARKKLAELSAENLGTGAPATPADCPANASASTTASTAATGASNVPRS